MIVACIHPRQVEKRLLNVHPGWWMGSNAK